MDSTNVMSSPHKLYNEINSLQTIVHSPFCNTCGGRQLKQEDKRSSFFQHQGKINHEITTPLSKEDQTVVPYVSSSHKIIGFIPIISQIASIFYIITLKTQMAKIMQVLFAQGFIDFWKFLFSIFISIYQSPKKFIPQKCQRHTFQKHQIDGVLSSATDDKQKESLQTSPSPGLAPLSSSSSSSSSLLQPAIGLSSWMDPLQDTRLCDLCLPATHNSHAYLCQPTPFGTDWVLCQQMTVKEQLEAGIRLLDLRVSSKTYFGHGPALTERINIVAKDICDYLSKHPNQVVVCLVRPNSITTPKQMKNSNLVQLVHSALQKELDTTMHQSFCQCTSKDSSLETNDTVTTAATAKIKQQLVQHNVNIYLPKTLKDANNLKRKTLRQINNYSSYYQRNASSLILEPASFWQGSWGQTRSNIASSVVEKCLKWAVPLDDKPHSTTHSSIGGDSSTRTTTALSTTASKKHRLMELICTVDAGTTSKTIQIAILHSVKSLNRKLMEEVQRNGSTLFEPSILCHLQGLMLDYPTEHQILSVVAYNHHKYRTRRQNDSQN